MTTATLKKPVYGNLTDTDLENEMSWMWYDEVIDWAHIKLTREEVLEKVINIYYQGEPGAYSHGVSKLMEEQLQITQEWLEKEEMIDGVKKKVRYRIWEIIGLASFPLVHKKIAEGHIGVLPIGNTIAGPVWENMNYFYNTKWVKVLAGIYERIRHMLMGLKWIKLEDVTKVISHWQALAQCERNVQDMGYDAVDFGDTAGAAKHISETWVRDTLALASQAAAERYGLEIYREDMQDNSRNRTKFFVMGKEGIPVECKKKPNITIISLHVAEWAGSLNRFLNILDIFDINSTEIHSTVVPWSGEDLSYNIFQEISGTVENEKVKLALIALSDRDIRMMLTHPKMAHIMAYLWNGDKGEGLKELWKWNIANALSAVIHPEVKAFLEEKELRYISRNMERVVQDLQALIEKVNGHGEHLQFGEDVSIVGTYYYNELEA